MKKLNIIVVLTVALLSACQRQAAPPQGPEPAPAPVATTEEQAAQAFEAAVTEIEARCARVQQSDNLPISCQLDMVDGTARLQIVMSNRAAAQTYMDAAEQDLIVPFCRLTSLVQQPAGVVMSLYEEQLMRFGDCSTMQYTDWQSSDQKVQELTAAARACQALQESSYPIGCSMGVLDNVPSLLVRYSSTRVSEQDLVAIGRLVGAPFCSATASSGVEAYVYLVADDERAQGYDCMTQQQTAWFAVRRPRPPSRAPKPGRPANGDSAGGLAQRAVVFERLPMRAQN